MTLPAEFDDWLRKHDPEPPSFTGDQVLTIIEETCPAAERRAAYDSLPKPAAVVTLKAAPPPVGMTAQEQAPGVFCAGVILLIAVAVVILAMLNGEVPQ